MLTAERTALLHGMLTNAAYPPALEGIDLSANAAAPAPSASPAETAGLLRGAPTKAAPAAAPATRAAKKVTTRTGGSSYGALSTRDDDEVEIKAPAAPIAQAPVTAEVIRQLHLLKLANELFDDASGLLKKDLVLHELETRKKDTRILWAMFATNGEEARLKELPQKIDDTVTGLYSKEQAEKFKFLRAFHQENNFAANALRVINNLRVKILEGKEAIVAIKDFDAAEYKLPADIDIDALTKETANQLNETYVKQKIAALHLEQIITLIKAKASFNQEAISIKEREKLKLCQAQLAKLQEKIAPLEGIEKQLLSLSKLKMEIPPKTMHELRVVNTAFALYKASTKLFLKEIDFKQQQKALQKFPVTARITAADEKQPPNAKLAEIKALKAEIESPENNQRFEHIEKYAVDHAGELIAEALRVINHLHVIMDEQETKEDLNSAACKLPDGINIGKLVSATAHGIDETYIKQKITVIYLKQMTALMQAQMTQNDRAIPANYPEQLKLYTAQLAALTDKMLSGYDEYKLHGFDNPAKAPTSFKA